MNQKIQPPRIYLSFLLRKNKHKNLFICKNVLYIIRITRMCVIRAHIITILTFENGGCPRIIQYIVWLVIQYTQFTSLQYTFLTSTGILRCCSFTRSSRGGLYAIAEGYNRVQHNSCTIYYTRLFYRYQLYLDTSSVHIREKRIKYVKHIMDALHNLFTKLYKRIVREQSSDLASRMCIHTLTTH